MAPTRGNDRGMTVVKINAITVREGSGDELARSSPTIRSS